MSIDDTTSGVSRRTVLGATAAAAGAAVALPGPAAAQAPDFDGWLADTSNYDGVTDATGRDEVRITVGAQGNGGAFAFGPPAVRIDPGTTVVWEWNGEGGQHNVRAMEGGEFESDLTAEAGFTFEHAFEEEGVVTYQCDPHATLGMKGVVVVGDVDLGGGGGGGQVGGGGRPDFGGWLEDVDGGYTDARGQGEVTVQVGAQGNGGAFAFEPAGLWVDPGTTVTWEWTGEGGQHNVATQDGGEFESELTAEEGFTFEHTFEERGIVTYQCDPHATLGMKGAVAVGDVQTAGGPPAGGGGGDGGARPFTPPGGAFGATFMLFLLGSAAVAALAVLGGELYHAVRTGDTAAPTEEEAEIVREIGHDEFEPIGTASLIVVYFLILVVLWVFVYFVEFLGNGPTVTG